MILIDALYINSSGGLHLLEILLRELQQRSVGVHLMADDRCEGKLDGLASVEYIHASMRNRNHWYKKNDANQYECVLCFGNIPTPCRLDVPVFTYFHNINLLTLAEAHGLIKKVKSWLKREVYRIYKKHTNLWIVQTTNTANELMRHIGEPAERVRLMPYFELPKELEEISKECHGEDYVYISDHYPRAKGHEELLKAWKLLHKRGMDRTLHLTVHEKNVEIIAAVEDARKEGVNVVNHGFVPFSEVLNLYRQSKAIIYPSHNESLGLGIVEAITAGCDVLGADLPYLHAICKPSLTFNPYSPESIANAIVRYEEQKSPKPELLICDHLEELIDLLTDSSNQKNMQKT